MVAVKEDQKENTVISNKYLSISTCDVPSDHFI